MTMNKSFGPFELKERIGSGGMASVYLAVQKSLQRQVVLKVLYPHLAEDEKLVARFEREARAAAMMRHENIVQVIDCGREEEAAYICMEFVQGLDLQKWLETHGTPPIEMALLMLRDLCRGLEHAHGHRIIHRDIKPANIMLTPDGTIKIMDFGLARSGSESNTQVTMVGSVIGTPAYMSPEQATGEPVDERSDIFSTGVVAYELLGGTRPFKGESYSTVMRAILTVEPPELTQFNPLVPEGVAAIVRKMLAKDVGKRYATIAEAREDFEGVIEQLGLLRGKDLLKEFALDPAAVGQKWRQKRLSRHLDQGLYFENMGLGKIDDALLEFRRVLHLDPNSPVAKEHVKKLERDRDKVVSRQPPAAAVADDSTLMMSPADVQSVAVPVEPPASAPAKARVAPVPKARVAPAPKASPAPGPAAAGKSQLSLPVLAAIALGVIGVIVVAVMMLSNRAHDSTAATATPVDSLAMETPLSENPQATESPIVTDTPEAAGPGASTTPTTSPATTTLDPETRTGAPATTAVRPATGATAPVGTEEKSGGRPGKPAVATTPATAPVAGPNGKFVINATPSATVFIDGEKVAEDVQSWRGSVKPGPHAVRIEHPVYGSKTWSIDLKPGATQELSFDLFAAATGTVSVTAEGGSAEIYLDGQTVGHPTPWVVTGVLPGKHKLTLVAEGFSVAGGAKTVIVKAGQQSEAAFKLKPKR